MYSPFDLNIFIIVINAFYLVKTKIKQFGTVTDKRSNMSKSKASKDSKSRTKVVPKKTKNDPEGNAIEGSCAPDK